MMSRKLFEVHANVAKTVPIPRSPQKNDPKMLRTDLKTAPCNIRPAIHPDDRQCGFTPPTTGPSRLGRGRGKILASDIGLSDKIICEICWSLDKYIFKPLNQNKTFFCGFASEASLHQTESYKSNVITAAATNGRRSSKKKLEKFPTKLSVLAPPRLGSKRAQRVFFFVSRFHYLFQFRFFSAFWALL